MKHSLKKLLEPSLIFFFSLNVLLWDIQAPTYAYFDELNYIEAGKQFFGGLINLNWSQPPLAKFLIGLGVHWLGDNPLGWRFMSAVFGSATLVIMYCWARIIFRDRPFARAWAVLVFVLSLLNQVHYLQSRIALLDVFMFCFMVLGLCLFTWSYFIDGRKSILLLAGSALGLSIACKWPAVTALPFCVLAWTSRNFKNGRGPAVAQSLFYFVLVPVIVYFLSCASLVNMKNPSYAPVVTQSGNQYADLLPMQYEIFKAQSQFSNDSQPYTSHWLTWPLTLTPMWFDIQYAKGPAGEQQNSGILYMGNPLIMWGGLLAVIFCLWQGIVRRHSVALYIGGCYLSLWLSWALIPRKIGFYYYYYPASMILSLALAFTLRELKWPVKWVVAFVLATMAIFLFFFPTMTDESLDLNSFLLRAWLPGRI